MQRQAGIERTAENYEDAVSARAHPRSPEPSDART